MALTDKQQRFVDEYVGHAKWNGAEAARRAGYTGTETTICSTASKLLANEEVSAAIQRRMDKLAAKCDVTAERVIQELALLGFSNMADFMSQGLPDQNPSLDLRNLTREQSAAIQELTVDTIGPADGPVVMRTKVKLSDKRGALELLGKHLGIFKDPSPEVSVNVSLEPKIYLPDNGRD